MHRYYNIYGLVYAMVRQNIDTGQNQGIVSMTELHIYALKGLAHPRRNTHRDQKCVNSTRVSNPVLVYYLWFYGENGTVST